MTTTDPKTVKARKPHKCYWCGEPISPGDVYEQWTCFDDGNATNVKVHGECKEAWDKGLGMFYEEEVGFGEHCRGCLCQRPHCECGKRTQ